MELNIDQIEAILPHRFPFLLVDKITECTPGERASWPARRSLPLPSPPGRILLAKGPAFWYNDLDSREKGEK